MGVNPAFTGVLNPYWVNNTVPLKCGKNGDRRHKSNKGVNQYRRKTDTKMLPEELTRRILKVERYVEALREDVDKMKEVARIGPPKSLRRRVLDWLLD
jgi:hypothetical protein